MTGSFSKNRIIHESDFSNSLSSSLMQNIDNLKVMFESCDDIIFHITQFSNQAGCLVYLSEMVSTQAMFEIEQGLSSYSKITDLKESVPSFIHKRFTYSTVMEIDQIQHVVEQILAGNTVLLVDEIRNAFVFRSINTLGRTITDSVTERTVRGPREGFVEDLQKNVMLIRRKIKTSALKVENVTIGKQTNTQISVVYIKGIASDEIIKEVHHRLERINIDGILESHYIEAMIKDSPRSPVPTVFSTERPDRVCGGLLDGKVAILVDGSPFALTVPALFVEFLHSNEDYYDSSLVATLLRWIRFLGLFITLILPAFYIALTTFHQDLLQDPFLIKIAADRESLPYPVVIEAIFMLLTFELVREAGLRMPKTFGGATITILGLVIISQTAVQAGIIGPELAVVISVTSLTSFILPNYSFHQIIRFSSVPLLILAGIFGFMGIIVGLMFGLAYLVSLRSFGVPYFSPVSPARKESWKDVFIRAPWWAMKTRPAGLDIENSRRAGDGNYAKPPQNKEEDEE
ncbi:spore germination protein [Neobacillus sp. PS3-40]|uniref:spore germination protein n=1 Tax=Neobacillus sp. PS3-40 TaxID=3070679 RepID=UPI0027E0C0AC|nr:spore germination protein [Neobacillus sp. PS3-40]WML44028.1 spore germination protein [Neobacillus sp. PS3-40]